MKDSIACLTDADEDTAVKLLFESFKQFPKETELGVWRHEQDIESLIKKRFLASGCKLGTVNGANSNDEITVVIWREPPEPSSRSMTYNVSYEVEI